MITVLITPTRLKEEVLQLFFPVVMGGRCVQACCGGVFLIFLSWSWKALFTFEFYLRPLRYRVDDRGIGN